MAISEGLVSEAMQNAVNTRFKLILLHVLPRHYCPQNSCVMATSPRYAGLARAVNRWYLTLGSLMADASNLVYLRLEPQADPPVIASPTPFRAVLIAETHVATEWQALISDWLVRSGCLYLVAHGIDCSAWDSAVDLANIAAFDCGDIPDEGFVMTTWHADESLEETFWFAKNLAFHPTIELTRTLLLHIATSDRECEFLQAYSRAADV